ncbi:hypothetical protein CK228_08800 [Mesorhizobium sp. WSM4312]|nr:hypothetical protein CK228_08800 [Mesorhizobium sp. WSM4312]
MPVPTYLASSRRAGYLRCVLGKENIMGGVKAAMMEHEENLAMAASYLVDIERMERCEAHGTRTVVLLGLFRGLPP